MLFRSVTMGCEVVAMDTEHAGVPVNYYKWMSRKRGAAPGGRGRERENRVNTHTRPHAHTHTQRKRNTHTQHLNTHTFTPMQRL